jgi:fibrillarin-like rRNA methylase
MDIKNSYRKIIEIMKNILEEIAARTRERIAKEKSDVFLFRSWRTGFRK